jgi:SAM-dependent methyltransferase
LNRLPDYVERNRDSWERRSDAYQDQHSALLERHEGRAWGVWRIPESELHVLGEVEGLDVLELGCGAARWSAALARLGSRSVALDVSPRQLEHARRTMAEAGVEFTLIEASAEDIPLPGTSFDIIFCDHGAFSVADPRRVMPECARLLRDGGLLAFTKVSPLFDIAYDARTDRVGDRLRNDYFGLDRVLRDDAIDFQLTFGEWIRLFHANGFEVEDLIEIRPPKDASSTFELVPLDWARRWPAENIWKARRRR